MSRFLLCSFLAACGVDSVADASQPPADSAPLVSPEVRSAVPENAAVVAPEIVVRVVFSAPMDRDVSGRAMALSFGDTLVSGSIAWDASGTVMAFRPSEPLSDGDYVLVVDEAAAGADGVPLAEPFLRDFAVVAGTTRK